MNPKADGWIKLHRKILMNKTVLKDTDHLAVWIYLLLSAVHSETEAKFEGVKITLKPGQLITSRADISRNLNVSESKVQRILRRLEGERQNERQIEQQTTPRNRLISILNWHEYQESEQQNERQNDYLHLSKEYIIYTQFDNFWKVYPKKVGKKEAKSRWDKLKVTESLWEEIQSGLKRLKTSEQWMKDGGK
jgi:hypothetical protein